MQDLPFTCRQAWAPYLWSQIGFPHSVNSLTETKFCSDNMQYHRLDQILINLTGGITAVEFEDAKEIMKLMSRMFGHGHLTIPYSSILNAIYQLRIIRQVVPSARSIFEIGPGPGYLAYLAHKHLGLKSRVSCLENVQAYYLHQSLLWKKTGKLIELAKDTPRSRDSSGTIEHIPWWVFARSYTVDHEVIFGGHVICEMSEVSVRQVLARSVASSQVPAIIFESSGDQRLTQMKSRIDLIHEYGFVKTFEQLDLYVFIHPKTKQVIRRDVENFTSNFKFKARARWHLKNMNLKAEDEANFYLKLLLLGNEKEEIVPIERIVAEYEKYNVVNWDEEFLNGIRA